MTRSNLLVRATPMLQAGREMWQSSFASSTASAMAIRKGWMAEEFASAGALLAPPDGADERFGIDWRRGDSLASVFREGGSVAPICERARGADTAVLALTWVDEYQGIFARTDGALRDLGDLKGARLGLPANREREGFPRAVALRGLVTGLTMAGIRWDQVVFVGVGGERDGSVEAARARRAEDEQVEALLAGQVDAVFLRARAAARAARNPAIRELVDLNQHADPLARLNSATLRPLVVDRSFLHTQPETVVRYLAVLLRTAAWAEHQHDEVVRLLSAEGSGLSAEDVVEVYGPEIHRSFTPALTSPYVHALEEQKNFLRDWRFLRADFSISSWIDAEPLARARALAKSQPPLFDEQDRLPSLERRLAQAGFSRP